jgi:hypothetical protein
MTGSLRALLAGAIDYAGMFPPAGLPLEQALAKYRQHRSGPEAWMVGRFVCPLGKFAELATGFDPERDGHVAVILNADPNWKTAVEDLGEGLAAVRKPPDHVIIDSIELRWEGTLGLEPVVSRIGGLAQGATGVISASERQPVRIFIELGSDNESNPSTAFVNKTRDLVQMLDFYNQAEKSFRSFRAGFKIRCGGEEPSAIPSLTKVAAVISACRDHAVFWKATAGLHHPFRHVDSELGAPMHGFVNLLTAAVMADVHRLNAGRVQAILEDDDPWHFRFTNEALTWRDLSATVPQIASARERALRSFGSCSIDEPWQDLTVLGLI